MQTPQVTILGAGSYGTALAICFARKGIPTMLWGRDSEKVALMTSARENAAYLPGCPFPESLQVTDDLELALKDVDNVVVVVPSHSFSSMLKQAKPLLKENARVAWATKGLEPDTGRLLYEVAEEILADKHPLAVLSGPTFAIEMAKGLPTAISMSSTDQTFVDELSDMLHCDRSFRVYTNNDFIGVQLGGVVKNVIAIGAGMADGIGFGANARTALITRGLAELTRLGLKLGAKSDTFTGMAGLGDLILTCTDNQSRNRRFGLALGEGKSVEQALKDIGQSVEGYRNTKEVVALASRNGVEMPIAEQIYAVLYEGKEPQQAAIDLLSRERKTE
ncbi:MULTISPECIES: NAD(P)H-dependent glycerol-3-phosphate dehydrogenase [Idiomarina]|jgi:glycerol-3-phosphate dehydrogenase (NAD(P)+)|uniref:Glycerol-3-phosphate dehydrogenase [NAD(P)+] n=1 Tax=Idiomarina zobellii TaxID=86103 RepID=A0A837NI72_9GAMM|nr:MULTISPECIES: NAD(P)H-dependent glycerol-3-phosphate dehydrogenase [Idiomarina]KPD24361.1 glycerol-3-phosphate dehydrogenase [Idiomarina zobellii]MBF38918.1 NAD(P)H-dependent glycerol-3-phosphate dehydrogenase [Idiomarinaceae bacterium]MCJ8317445.1 NAD(P)H-dependent glycerol-3-phosphate dehydrogenase [Idiomarina sp.]NQZ17059.1 NAD(P)H-dependent glycerol-3-phosphate dehydrogenase [Idiomarina sp.]|tara:strand:+ start:533 stop:1534 length:1002 start_codon:yes stop_codon:yes gene_type:complete